MPNILIPVAKKIFICDDVVGDPLSGKASILNVWNAIRAPQNGFPYVLGKVCVFAQFRGGLGDISTHVEIVNADTGKMLRKSGTFVLGSHKNLQNKDQTGRGHISSARNVPCGNVLQSRIRG